MENFQPLELWRVALAAALLGGAGGFVTALGADSEMAWYILIGLTWLAIARAKI